MFFNDKAASKKGAAFLFKHLSVENILRKDLNYKEAKNQT